MPPTPAQQTVAVIDIGSSAIRMLIAELSEKADIRYLENLHKDVHFGRDVFAHGRIERQTANEGIKILANYKEVCNSYGVSKIQAVATSALREATNRDNFIDRAFVRTGIEIETIEGPEENRLELIAVEMALADKIKLEDRNCLIIEVGSGSTEMMILNKGQVEFIRTLSIGSLRLPNRMEPGRVERDVVQRTLKRSVKDITLSIANDYSLDQIDTLIAIGADMRFVAKELQEIHDERFLTLEKKEFVSFVGKLSRLSVGEMTQKYGIPLPQAQTLYTSLLYYYEFLQQTQTKEIIIPMVSIRDGILFEMAQINSAYKRTDVSKQIINSAKHLAKKYDYDKAHTHLVASLALKLFDNLKQEHGMGSRERVLLEVAAILHDIGVFISHTAHHKHSSYLIHASDIFGLRQDEKSIVANVVRYHRKAVPNRSHLEYISLEKDDRARVSKLAAILRIADALDADHQQRIRNFELERSEKRYTLWVTRDVGDISSERNALEQKGKLFADIYGLPIILRRKA